jgi:hypothetical protein
LTGSAAHRRAARRREVVLLAPLVLLGAHSALGPVSQNNVVSTVRACEVAADPTNALALEAASRRARARERLAHQKERLLILGLSTDRLAAFAPPG